METQITFLGIIISMGIAMIILGIVNRKRQERWLEKRLLDAYGKIPEKRIPPENVSRIPEYFRRHAAEDRIDDITWNDLDMDDIFRRIDSTLSAAGEEYLYYVLRTPDCDPGMARRISALEGDDRTADRLMLQKALYKLSGTGKYSIYEYMSLLKTLGRRSSAPHYAALVFPFAALAVMVFHVQAGLILFILSIIVNMLTYFNEKGKIEPFIVSFRYLLRMISCADEMSRTPVRGLEPEQEALRRLRAEFADFVRGSGIVMSQSQTGSGNPFDAVLDYLRIILHLDLIKFNSMYAKTMERQQQIDSMITIVGGIDAAIAAASFRKTLPYWCSPVFTGDEGSGENGALEISELYHPLLTNPVSNSITAARPVLLTGSNASGKSTFIKAVALCSLLGQTIATCPAASWRGRKSRILSSMALRDSIQEGESYFMVEIKSLRRILDAGGSVLCFIDEVLRGTNTIERIAASSEILMEFAKRGILCFAATHDIELTEILAEYYDNYHFEEELTGGDVAFSYRLHEGPATTRNAIRLLEKAGFDADLTARANERAARFEKEGSWLFDLSKAAGGK